MGLSQALVEKGTITSEQLESAQERRKLVGGFVFESLLLMGFLSREQLNEVCGSAPAIPRTLEATGMEEQFLLDFVLKSMYISVHETVSEISQEIKLSKPVVELLLIMLRDRGLVEISGSAESQFLLRHALTERGRARAVNALSQSAYVGPAPVPLEDYYFRVEAQSIVNERVDLGSLKKAMSDLVLPSRVLRQLGPAVNSGKALLLYGPSGNGKTSVAERLGLVFRQTVYIPHALKVDQQIIKVYDEAVHRRAEQESPPVDEHEQILDRWGAHDPRWVACRRPVLLAGGELTLGMLDLDFDPQGKFYEAPLQVKAMGGVLVIDDFGRQRVNPEELLNRWIVPLERKVDYLTLHTGKKFEIPFDAIVVFSTNLSPAELMDAAFLRRISYKVMLGQPTLEEYTEIFRRLCEIHGLKYSEKIVSYLLAEFYEKYDIPLCSVHPKLIIEHSEAAGKFYGWEPRLTHELIEEAVANLAERIQETSRTAPPVQKISSG